MRVCEEVGARAYSKAKERIEGGYSNNTLSLPVANGWLSQNAKIVAACFL